MERRQTGIDRFFFVSTKFNFTQEGGLILIKIDSLEKG